MDNILPREHWCVFGVCSLMGSTWIGHYTLHATNAIQQQQWTDKLPTDTTHFWGSRRRRLLSAAADGGSSNSNAQRHVIITGGNCGIGKATATELAKRGMSITLACRNKEKGDIACSEISRLSGNPHVRAMVCDLASFKSVRQFVKEYQGEGLPLHVLVNNAGIMACPQSYTEDGFEKQFGVNHLGHFLLTVLLLETLVESASSGLYSRVVVLASAAEIIGNINFEDLNFKCSRGYNRWIAYGQSKLANCLFSYELSRRCRAENIRVTSNSMHPGIVDTQLIRHILPQMMVQNEIFPDLRRIILKVLGLKTPEEGASTAVHLACSEMLEGVSGFHFEDSRMRDPSSQARNGKLALELWEVSEKLTGTDEVLLGMARGNGQAQSLS